MGSARERTIAWIRREFGPLDDLPAEIVPVVWVTAFRSMETRMEADAKGLAGLVQDVLHRGDLKGRVLDAAINLDFTHSIVNTIRGAADERERRANAELFVDMMKWGIVDAGDMTAEQRDGARAHAIADALYDAPAPDELLARGGA